MPAAGERSFTSAIRSKPPALSFSGGGTGVARARASTSSCERCACAARTRSRLLSRHLLKEIVAHADAPEDARKLRKRLRAFARGAAVDGVRRELDAFARTA